FFFLVCLVYFRVCGCSYLFGCVYVIFGLFFFFSSRRRHTRSKRDWSSDVCSFDLGCRADFSCSSNRYYLSSWAFMSFLIFVRSRSEERRVGKECWFRWETSALEQKANKKE